MALVLFALLFVAFVVVAPVLLKTSKGSVILTYHKVEPWSGSPGEQKYTVTPEVFKSQMRWLKKRGYNVIPLGDVLSGVYGDTSVKTKSVSITFDDGYMNLVNYSFPCLDECQFPATVFAVANHVGNVNVWDMQEGFDKAELMGWEILRKIGQQRIAVESHGLSHKKMAFLDGQAVKEEVGVSRQILEDRLDKPVEFICYPYGSYSSEVILEVKSAGYRGGCCNIFGRNLPGVDVFQLRRIRVNNSDTSRRLWWKMHMTIWYESYRIIRGMIRSKTFWAGECGQGSGRLD